MIKWNNGTNFGIERQRINTCDMIYENKLELILIQSVRKIELR